MTDFLEQLMLYVIVFLNKSHFFILIYCINNYNNIYFTLLHHGSLHQIFN